MSNPNESTELDALLNEYPQSQPKPDPDIKELADYVRSDRQDKVNTASNDAISSSVTTIKDDESLKGLADSEIEDFLQGEGRRDPTISAAFEGRETNPEAWKAAQNTVKTRLIERESTRSADQTTNDVTAAVASARGIQSTEPADTAPYRNSAKEVADISAMSDMEYQQYKAKVAAESG